MGCHRLARGQEDRSYSSRRFRITQIMETLAELAVDIDVVAEVLARDQSSAYQLVRLAELYQKAGRYDDALAWAEQGLALPGGSDSRMLEAAAEESHRAGRGAGAVRIAWDAYEAAPSLRTGLGRGSAVGCRRNLWLELGRRRKGERPLDAIPIWQGGIERAINAKSNQAYAEAVELIGRVRRLLIAADGEADFAPYLAQVRAAHKPKRNLMKLFDERSW